MTHKDELILDLWRELLHLGHELPGELRTRVEWVRERMRDKEDKRRIKAIADPVRREQELLAFKRNYQGADTGRWLLGGQHRLRAVIQADVTLPFFVAHGLDISAQDVMDAAGHALAIAGFSYSKTRPAAAAMLRFIKKGVVPRLSVAEILQDVYSQRDLFDLALPTVGPVNELGLARPAIVFAVGMAFFEANAEKASEFFSRLASGSKLPIDHPILTLRNRLMGEKAGRTKKEERHGYLTVGLWISAWNAFVEGRTLTTRGLKHTQVDSNNKYVVPPIRKGEKHD